MHTHKILELITEIGEATGIKPHIPDGTVYWGLLFADYLKEVTPNHLDLPSHKEASLVTLSKLEAIRDFHTKTRPNQ